MAWSMPNTGPWNPVMGMTPDMSLGAYSVKEWSDMQQHNWQEWAQWQQQYTQWHSQYGEKYAQQYQTMQHVGPMPVLLPMNPSAPPAPPPPPDEPPPPPPHENNQPLFTQTQPAPVPPPTSNQQWNPNYNNTNLTSSKSKNWSTSNSNTESQQTVNSEALKKLAEEERLFDIQFEKWEEEIDKWRKENVNHPDKKAYKEYEEKFEACRAQLMERRNQMKAKRAKLLSNSQVNSATLSVQTQQATASPHNPTNQTNFKTEHPPNSHYLNQQLNTPQSTYNKDNKNIDPQDRYESYENIVGDMRSHKSEQSVPSSTDFLPTASSSKGIPGLDLVHDTDKMAESLKKQDVVDITNEIENHQQAPPKQPDYTTISKGINNILGDEKIMNILSMVRGNIINVPDFSNINQSSNFQNDTYYVNNQHNYINYPDNKNQSNYNTQQQQQSNFNNQRQQSNYNNQQQEHRQNIPFNRQQNQETDSRCPPQKMTFQGREENNSQDQYYHNYNTNVQGGGQSSRPTMYENNQGSLPVMSVPTARPLFQEISGQQNMNYPNRPSEMRILPNNHLNCGINQPQKPKWTDEPLFTPFIIVEYEHKPLRLKARDFIKPVHTFDYNHKSKDSDLKKMDFEKEVDGIFPKQPGSERDNIYEYNEKHRARDYERRSSIENTREDYYTRAPPRTDFERRHPDDKKRSDARYYDDRKRPDDRYDDRKRPDDRYDERKRDRSYSRREDFSREHDSHRDDKTYKRDDRDLRRDDRDLRRDDRRSDLKRDYKNDRLSQDRESRKRGHSCDSESDVASKISMEFNKPVFKVVMIDDLLEPPGREMRPEKIVIILRGPPGSGKSYLAKLIRDKEAEYGGSVRIMSIDDYFVQENLVEETDPVTGKNIKKAVLKYEYDAKLEASYLNSLKRAFKRSLNDGYFSFIIFDAVNEHLRAYGDMWNISRQSGFQVYICTMETDPQTCFKRNIHNRTLNEIQVICTRFFPTPSHHIQLDPTTLLQSAAIQDVHMEDVKHDEEEDNVAMDTQENEVPLGTQVENVFTSKWEKMDTTAQLARLDGTNKPLRSSQLSMEDYLQLDEWKPNKVTPGKKSVRWADIEERREQEKMRAIGFVVGQTDWNRMTDPTLGSRALTQTKYIERVRRN